MNGRTLGIDPGEVRIGLALSDLLGVTAQPAATLGTVGSRKDLNTIADFAREHEVHTVVIGLPLLMSGEEGPAALASREMAQGLERRLPGVRVELWDERLTSVQAERTMVAGDVSRKKRKRKVDSLAAVLILQNWLDAQAFQRAEAD
jgi:putative Holliday junction resolvase